MCASKTYVGRAVYKRNENRERLNHWNARMQYFGAASHGDVCTAEEYINIEAEQ
jgi:hypothetical protein